MRRLVPAIGLIATLVILLPAAAGSAQMSTTDQPTLPAPAPDSDSRDMPDVPPPTSESGISEAELQDLATIAEQNGINLDEAIRWYAWQDNLTFALDEIRAVTDQLAEAAITGDTTASVTFAGRAPVEAARILARFSAAFPAVTVDVQTGTGFTEAALEEAVVRVHQAVYGTPGVSDAHTGYDSSAQQIVTSVALRPGVGPELLPTLRDVSMAALADDEGQGIADVLTTRVELQAWLSTANER